MGQPRLPTLGNTIDFPEITYDWDGAFIGVAPGYVCKDAIAWFFSHRHSPDGENEIYDYCYMFQYSLALPLGAKKVVLPVDRRVRLFAASLASGTSAITLPVSSDLGVI